MAPLSDNLIQFDEFSEYSDNLNIFDELSDNNIFMILFSDNKKI